MSTAAASHLSPAFPERAAWGTASKLRAWQADALTQYLRTTPRDFLAVATPGAGKTMLAKRIADDAEGISTNSASDIPNACAILHVTAKVGFAWLRSI